MRILPLLQKFTLVRARKFHRQVRARIARARMRAHRTIFLDLSMMLGLGWPH
jgi:hypothetical protein